MFFVFVLFVLFASLFDYFVCFVLSSFVCCLVRCLELGRLLCVLFVRLFVFIVCRCVLFGLVLLFLVFVLLDCLLI